MKKAIPLGFVAGALAVLVFHQGTLFLLYHQYPLLQGVLGLPDAFRPAGPGFSMTPVPPFGVPQIVSICFWGGVWGIVLAAILRWLPVPDLLAGLVVGALGASFVAFTLVAALKGLPLWAGGDRLVWWRAALLNGAWGWGTALLLRPLALRG